MTEIRCALCGGPLVMDRSSPPLILSATIVDGEVVQEDATGICVECNARLDRHE